MRLLFRWFLPAVLILASCSPSGTAQPTTPIRMPLYSVEVTPGTPPRLIIERDGERLVEVPVVSGLASDTQQEQLSGIEFTLRQTDDGYELNATAKSSLWSDRRFRWRFLPERIEFQQFAGGHGKLGRAYFLSNGV